MTARIGLLGASRIAESVVIGPAAELGHRVVAVAARDRSLAAVFAEKYAVERVLDGYQAVIDDAEVDVVYNPPANSQHAPWNLAAIAAGKPVLSEKPFARDQSEAQRACGTSLLGNGDPRNKRRRARADAVNSGTAETSPEHEPSPILAPRR